MTSVFRVQSLASPDLLNSRSRRPILCVNPVATGLCGLIQAFAQPGTTVEGVADLALAAEMICAAPEGFELVVLGDAIGRREATRFVERVRGAGYRRGVARMTAAELASGSIPLRTASLAGSAPETFSTDITV